MKKHYTQSLAKVFLLFLFFLNSHILFGQGSYPVLENIPANQVDEDVELLGTMGNRLLYFDIVNNQKKLWVSDATPTGTFQLGVPEQEDISLIAMTDDTWYFEENIAGVYHISELTVGNDNLVSLYNTTEDIEKALLWNGSIYFTVDSETVFAADDLVKFTPATSASEVLFTSEFGGIRGLGSTDSNVMFVADMNNGKWLGKTDGTLTNTSLFHMVYDPGSASGIIRFMVSDGEKLFFAYNPSGDPINMFVTDGTSSGTQLLGGYDNPSFSLPDDPYAFLDGNFYFVLREEAAPSGTTFELHVSDGTPGGTFNLNPNSSGYLHPRLLTVFNDKVYFNSLDNNWGLMSTDGTVAGTETVIEPFGYQSGGIGQAFENGLYNGSLVVQARSEDTGSEIYTSDGTLAGTTLLSDVIPGTEGSSPTQFTQVGDFLFFIAEIDNDPYLYVFDPNFNSMPCINFALDSISVTNTIGTDLGSIQIEVSGGSEPYSYQLNGGAATNNPLFENLPAGPYTVLITDANGCTLEIQVDVDMETNILNPNLVNSFQVFPNPVNSENLNLKMSFIKSIESVEIEVYDILGKRIFQQNSIPVIGNNLELKIPTNSFSRGEYFIFISSENQKLVVDKFTILGSN